MGGQSIFAGGPSHRRLTHPRGLIIQHALVRLIALALVFLRLQQTRAVFQQDGPSHLGSRLNALPGQQMALITSDYVATIAAAVGIIHRECSCSCRAWLACSTLAVREALATRRCSACRTTRVTTPRGDGQGIVHCTPRRLHPRGDSGRLMLGEQQSTTIRGDQGHLMLGESTQAEHAGPLLIWSGHTAHAGSTPRGDSGWFVHGRRVCAAIRGDSGHLVLGGQECTTEHEVIKADSAARYNCGNPR